MNSTAVDWLNDIGVIVSSPYQLHVEFGWCIEQLILFIFPIRAFIVGCEWERVEGEKMIRLGGVWVCSNVWFLLFQLGHERNKLSLANITFSLYFGVRCKRIPFTFAVLSNWIEVTFFVWERILFFRRAIWSLWSLKTNGYGRFSNLGVS
jgi:hypothetical protein